MKLCLFVLLSIACLQGRAEAQIREYRTEVSISTCGISCIIQSKVVPAIYMGSKNGEYVFEISLLPAQRLLSARIYHSSNWNDARIVHRGLFKTVVCTPVRKMCAPTIAQKKKKGIYNLKELHAQIDVLKLEIKRLNGRFNAVRIPIEHWNVSTGKLIRRNEYRLGETIKFGKLPFGGRDGKQAKASALRGNVNGRRRKG